MLCVFVCFLLLSCLLAAADLFGRERVPLAELTQTFPVTAPTDDTLCAGRCIARGSLYTLSGNGSTLTRSPLSPSTEPAVSIDVKESVGVAACRGFLFLRRKSASLSEVTLDAYTLSLSHVSVLSFALPASGSDTIDASAFPTVSPCAVSALPRRPADTPTGGCVV